MIWVKFFYFFKKFFISKDPLILKNKINIERPIATSTEEIVKTNKIKLLLIKENDLNNSIINPNKIISKYNITYSKFFLLKIKPMKEKYIYNQVM
jgi:hypothetical protein